MKRTSYLAFSLALLFTVASARASDNAAGLWKWTFATQNGESFETTLKLKQDGDKITGTLNNRYGESPITDATLKDGKIAFQIKRDNDGQSFTIKYTGKLQGDKIIGKTEFQRDGQTRERDWEARREGAKPAANTPNVAGAWDTALIISDDNRIESSLKLKQDAGKLNGVMIRNDVETQIQEGKINGDEITFKTTRDREGRTVTAKYKGKISGDTIKGKVESDWSGDWQTLDWEAKRAK